MIEEPSDDEAKGVYAHFGLAFYCARALEYGIANALLVLNLMEKRVSVKTSEEWENLVDKDFDGSFEKLWEN